MSDPLLEVDDLDVYYGKSQALDGVSLTVERGEIGGIIGPNGAGKTTLLDAVAGFLDYDGTIRSRARRGRPRPTQLVTDGLVYCTEDRDLFPCFGPREPAHGRAVREDREPSGPTWTGVGPVPAARRPPGPRRPDHERRRTADAGRRTRADGRPDLLVLDEPSLGLAPVILDDISDASSAERAVQRSCSSSRTPRRATPRPPASLLESGRVEPVAPPQRSGTTTTSRRRTSVSIERAWRTDSVACAATTCPSPAGTRAVAVHCRWFHSRTRAEYCGSDRWPPTGLQHPAKCTDVWLYTLATVSHKVGPLSGNAKRTGGKPSRDAVCSVCWNWRCSTPPWLAPSPVQQ